MPAECVQLDPHPLLHVALRRVLARVGVSVTASTTSGAEALDLVEHTHPELFVIEPLLPPDAAPGGLECILRSLRSDPHLSVVALSACATPEWRALVLGSGAIAFVPKSAPVAQVQSAIADALERARCGHEPLLSCLTAREREILALAADHRTNGEVAKMLWLSPETVKFHLGNAYRKLNVSSRSEAARWARRHGLTPIGPLLPASAMPAPRPRGWRARGADGGSGSDRGARVQTSPQRRPAALGSPVAADR